MTPEFRRLARRLGAVAALTALAGCGDRTEADGQPQQGVEDSTDLDSEHEPSTTTVTDSGDDARATTTADCETRREALDKEVTKHEVEIENLEWEYKEIDVPRRGLSYTADQIENGFPAATLETAETVTTAARESVVHVTVLSDGEESATGTGWFVSPDEILTNAHVVRDNYTQEVADRCRITRVDGSQFEAVVTGTPPEYQPDMALLRAEETGPPLELGTDLDLEPGQPLVQVGHPGGVGYWYHTLGRFVAREHWMLPDETEYYDIKTTVPGLEGASGSPVLDLEGRVVGLTWGGVPAWERLPGEPPVVAPAVVYDTPLIQVTISSHLGAESISRYLEEWR